MRPRQSKSGTETSSLYQLHQGRLLRIDLQLNTFTLHLTRFMLMNCWQFTRLEKYMYW